MNNLKHQIMNSKSSNVMENIENIFCEEKIDWNSPERKQLEYEKECEFILKYYGIDMNKCDY